MCVCVCVCVCMYVCICVCVCVCVCMHDGRGMLIEVDQYLLKNRILFIKKKQKTKKQTNGEVPAA